MTKKLLIQNVRPLGLAPVDLLIEDGRIARRANGISAAGAIVEDGGGAIALPGLVEAHTHLDKTLWGMGWRPHQAGPGLMDRIETERRLKTEWDIDAQRQSKRQAELSVAHGTTVIRSHVDVDTEVGLRGIEGVLATREELRDLVDIQIVAFPQSGLICRPGTEDLMDAALRAGADVIGGLDPCGIDRDPKAHLDIVFSLAEAYAKPVDIHLHEPDELGAFSMELIVERTRAHGMQGRVTISHAFCLGMDDRKRAAALVDQIAKERIAIATVATPSRPVPLAAELREAGVMLCLGEDGIRDTWNPYGSGDMLERAMLLGLRNGFRTDPELEYTVECATFEGAKVIGIENYGLTEGCVADIVLVDAETVAHAVVERPLRNLVVKRGRLVARDGTLLST